MPRQLTPADLPEEASLEERDEAQLVALRAAIDEGEASGVAEGNAFARVRARLGLTQS